MAPLRAAGVDARRGRRGGPVPRLGLPLLRRPRHARRRGARAHGRPVRGRRRPPTSTPRRRSPTRWPRPPCSSAATWATRRSRCACRATATRCWPRVLAAGSDRLVDRWVAFWLPRLAAAAARGEVRARPRPPPGRPSGSSASCSRFAVLPSAVVDLDDAAAVRALRPRPPRPRLRPPDHRGGPVRFALFYEIPVPRPWGPDSERRRLPATRSSRPSPASGSGWDAFWTVEHHFLEEYSHCSNPEVLYGAIAARTERIRLGYGVRLMPKPYNHPVRTRRVGRRARPHLRRPGRLRHRPVVDPGRARGLRHRPRTRPGRCGRRPSSTSSAAGPNDEHEFDGRALADAAAPGAAQAAAAAPPAAVGRDVAARTATARSARSASACARSPSACRPRRSRRRSTSTARPSAGCTEPDRRVRQRPRPPPSR